MELAVVIVVYHGNRGIVRPRNFLYSLKRNAVKTGQQNANYRRVRGNENIFSTVLGKDLIKRPRCSDKNIANTVSPGTDTVNNVVIPKRTLGGILGVDLAIRQAFPYATVDFTKPYGGNQRKSSVSYNRLRRLDHANVVAGISNIDRIVCEKVCRLLSLCSAKLGKIDVGLRSVKFCLVAFALRVPY